jgi:hypothetical protein
MVPRILPSPVRLVADGLVALPPPPLPSSSFAMPKSRIFGRRSGRTMMLSGLRSRWMTPSLWASASPSAISAAMRRASESGRGFPSMSCRRVRPSTYSMTMYVLPSDSLTSWTAAMVGWLTAAAARASRRKRRRSFSSEVRAGRRILMATWRLSRVSRAL